MLANPTPTRSDRGNSYVPLTLFYLVSGIRTMVWPVNYNVRYCRSGKADWMHLMVNEGICFFGQFTEHADIWVQTSIACAFCQQVTIHESEHETRKTDISFRVRKTWVGSQLCLLSAVWCLNNYLISLILDSLPVTWGWLGDLAYKITVRTRSANNRAFCTGPP